MKTQEAFSQARFQFNGNGYPGTCIGCAHTGAIRAQSHLTDYQQLLDWQKYALASAMYAYDKHLQFKDPREDMVAFLKICAPVAYTGYGKNGKTISHFGGLRVAPHQAIEYAGWGKAKQLAWDKAPNKDGELCYICYYDAGNSVYAGFVRSILTPEDRRELYNGVTDPREELLGDTLELALGVLTLATRYPSHFINWCGSEGANACVRGLERSIWRYAAAEAIELITADQPRARTLPKQDAEVTAYISNLAQGLNVTFEAVVDGDIFTASAEGNNESTEVGVALPMPEETAEARRRRKRNCGSGPRASRRDEATDDAESG